MDRKRAENLEFTGIAKGMIMVTAIGHLIFTQIHVDALLLLENEICGFIMFLFVLFGLVALFEATRIRMDQIRERIFTAAVCFAAALFGLHLTSIYRDAIANQRALETAAVNKAVIFSAVVIGIYVIAGVLLLVDLRRGNAGAHIREQKS